MHIHKAVIPAAGFGTRFLPATKAQPKEMLPLIDTPTIQFVVQEALSSGIGDILVITGRDKGSIEDHFDRSPELEEFLRIRKKWDMLEVVQKISRMAELHFIRQKEPMGLGHAVLVARRHVGNDPFCVLLGDDVMMADRPVLEQLMEFWRPGVSVVAVQQVAREEAGRYGIVFGREQSDGSIAVQHLVEKPESLDADAVPLAIMGRYILDPDIFPALERVAPGAGGEIQLTDALVEMARQNRLLAVPFTGVRFDVGDKLGFVKATVEFALRREDLKAEFEGYLRTLLAEMGRTQ